ncbi:MAG: precorrin-8X methylmutase [Rhodospirillales bacterium]
MTERIFDAYMMVDWSAASQPRTGANSVWICLREDDGGGRVCEQWWNPPTRAEAVALIADRLSDLCARDRFVLAGFDFAFGYPAGFAARLRHSRADWRAVWQEFAAMIEDDPTNANNRFAVAADLNRRISGEAAPFWGCPEAAVHSTLTATKPHVSDPEAVSSFRRTDRAGPGPKSVWQLFGAGSVGSQTLLGIARLEQLRRHPWLEGRVRVWPFETGLLTMRRPETDDWRVMLAEVYPSMLADDASEDEVKDLRQVRGLARHFAHLDREGRLAPLFAGPDLAAEERRRIETEEGWILGIGTDILIEDAVDQPSKYEYVRDPEEIYRRSFALIEEEIHLAQLPADLRSVAVRLVHTAGDPGLVADLRWSVAAATVGREALAGGAPILVDTEMVAAGIIRRRLPAANPVRCTLNESGVAHRAKRLRTTRSAAAVDAWIPWLAGSVVAIGNAPTALFRLLELIDRGAPPPAVILGFPVGFVGAAESKDALIRHTRGIPYIALQGRRGGSAFAAAAVNALARNDGLTG